MQERTLTDADVTALAEALQRKNESAHSAHCLLVNLFPDTEEGHKRLVVFKDVLDGLMKARNAIGTLVMLLIGVGVLIVLGVIVYAVTLGHVNPFRFLGIG